MTATTTTTSTEADESKQHNRRIERSCVFYRDLRPVKFVEICPIHDRCTAVTVTLSIDFQRVPTVHVAILIHQTVDQWSDFMHCFVNKLGSDAD